MNELENNLLKTIQRKVSAIQGRNYTQAETRLLALQLMDREVYDLATIIQKLK